MTQKLPDRTKSNDSSQSTPGQSGAGVGSDSQNPPPETENRSVYVENSCVDHARQINGNVVSGASSSPAPATYIRNVARGNSEQVNGSMDAKSFKRFLKFRK